MPAIARQIDPRDTSWEESEPAYRVYFNESDGSSEEWRITGVDSVNEVTEWADQQTHGRTYILYVEVRQDGTGLVRLSGFDPNAT